MNRGSAVNRPAREQDRRETVGEAVARRAREADPTAPPVRRSRPPAGGADRARRAEAGREAAAGPLSPTHRRRRRVAVGVTGVLLLAGLVVGGRVLLYDLGLADVEGVRVTGAATVGEVEVLAAAAVTPGGPLADVDTRAVARRVAQLPGVASVEVGRGWPHTVTVTVTERVVVAVADTSQGPRPVDASGVLYSAPVTPGLPRLTFGGIGPDDEATRAAIDVLAALPDGLRTQILTVDVSTSGGTPQVTLGLTEARWARWGTSGRGAEKAAVLVALLTRPGRVYDVTSPDLATVGS